MSPLLLRRAVADGFPDEASAGCPGERCGVSVGTVFEARGLGWSGYAWVERAFVGVPRRSGPPVEAETRGDG